MFLNGYPYTDFHEMNLDFLLKSMEALKQAFSDFTASNSLIFAEPLLFDITKSYAKNTIVLDPDGNAYISLQNVPSGVQLSDADYWLMVFNFEDYTEKANKNFTVNYFRDTTRPPYALSVGDWCVLDDVLYTVTQAIAADELFIIGTNLTHFTVEQFLKDFTTSIVQTVNQYKNDIDASEYAYRQQLAGDIAQTTASLQAQLDLAISGATVDSEVINARLGADGVTYATLGDAIRTQFTNTNNNIDTLETANFITSYDKTVLTNNAFLTYQGAVNSGANWRCSDPISCQYDEPVFIHFKLSGQYTSSTDYISNVAFYTSDGLLIYNEGYGSVTTLIEYERFIRVPSNAATMRFCTHVTYLDNAEINIYKAASDVVTDNADIFTNSYIYEVGNDLDTRNGYMNTSGVFVSAPGSKWCSTPNYIDCKKFNKCKYRLTANNAVGMICLYDANKVLIRVITGTTSSYATETGNIDISDASYIKACQSLSITDNTTYCKLYNDGIVAEAAPFYHITNKPYNFHNKRAHFFGDSIVYGWTQAGVISNDPWPKLFSQDVGFSSYLNRAVGGATFYPVSGYSDVLTQLQNDNLSTCDFIFIGAGINDWQLHSTLNDVKGAVADICDYLQNNFTGEVIFILPINQGGKLITPPPIATVDEYRNAIASVIMKYDYAIVNGKFFNFPDQNGDPSLITSMYGDKLHPSDHGYVQYNKALKTVLC